MNDVLGNLGLGALLAWAALPALAWTVRRSRDWEVRSRQRALAWVLALDVAFFALPFAREALWVRAVPVLPTSWMAPLVAASAPLPALGAGFAWTPLRIAGALWLALVALAALRAAASALRLLRLSARGTPPSAATLERVDAVARELGIRPPYVVCSDEQPVPFVTGLLRPTLVLPRQLMSALDGVAAELAIRHELVHLKRLDPWRASLASLSCLPLWPHPVAAKLRAELVLAREEAVDAEVAPFSPLAYSRLLVDAAAARLDSQRAVAMASGDLSRRIARLTDATALRPGRLDAVLICFCLVAGVLVAMPRAVARPVAPSAPVQTSDIQQIDLSVGAQTTLSIPGMQRFAVGDPGIADLKVRTDGQLQITGIAEGGTTVLVWKKSGVVTYAVQVQGAGTQQTGALPSRIDLAVGDRRTLALPGVERIAIGDTAVVDVLPLDGFDLRLTGRGAGQTTLLVWGPDGKRSSTLVSVGK